MDIDTIPLGVDFRKYVDGALKRTDFLLVVIGPQWLGPRAGGGNRIDDGNDPVRVEVAAALQNGVTTVIPLLIGGVPMPTPSDLPEELRDLSYVNAAEISSGRDFTTHVTRVIHFIDDTFRLRDEEQAAAATEATAQGRAKQAATEAEEERRAVQPSEAQRRAREAEASLVALTKKPEEARLTATALQVIARNWWALLNRGIVAVILGVLLFLWPGATIHSVGYLFGSYLLADGIFAIVATVPRAKGQTICRPLVVEGIVDILFAVLVFLGGRILTIAAWALLTGIFQLVAAVQLRKQIANEIWQILGGIASIAFGILVALYALAFFQMPGSLAIIWLYATYAIVLGIIRIAFSFRLRALGRPLS